MNSRKTLGTRFATPAVLMMGLISGSSPLSFGERVDSGIRGMAFDQNTGHYDRRHSASNQHLPSGQTGTISRIDVDGALRQRHQIR